MAANTTTLVRSEFTLAGPVSTTTMHPASQSLTRRGELNARVHQAHVRAHIRRLQSLGRGLPSNARRPQRRTRAVAHTITTVPTINIPTTNQNFPVSVPAPRRPLASLILNGLPTPSASPSPAPTQAAERPLLPTRRSRDRVARSGFHGTGAGLSFGLDLFGEDDPLFTPRVPEDGVRRTPGAPASTNGGREYFPAPSPASIEEEEGREDRTV